MITIIGAGLTGPFLAIALTKKGYDVELYEKLNKSKIKSSRSINLSLSERGMGALKTIGLVNEVQKITVKTIGRILHFEGDVTNQYSYTKAANKHLFTVERQNLQKVLYNECKRLGVNMHEGIECTSYTPHTNELFLLDKKKNEKIKKKCDHIIGADGCNSIIKKGLEGEGIISIERQFSSYGYKKFFIPKETVEALNLDPEYVHFWPRKGFFCMGLANIDGSITGGLVLPKEYAFGIPSFNLDNVSFWNSFSKHFPDLAENVPDLEEQLLNLRTSSFSMHTCSSWHHSNKSCLVGDAAHSILPWYAQGINCGFAECVSFLQLLDNSPNNLEQVFKAFENKNKDDSNAIAKLSEYNFNELLWNIKPMKKNIGLKLSKEIEEKMKIYSKVAFSNTPYSEILHEMEEKKSIFPRLQSN